MWITHCNIETLLGRTMSKKQINAESILVEALRRNDAEDRRAYLEATCGIDTFVAAMDEFCVRIN